MSTCLNCGQDIDESQTFCDDTCATEYLGPGEEDDDEDDDGYDG